MAELKRRRRSTGRDETGQRIVQQPEWGALTVFGLLMFLAPLAFGAGDPLIQVGLLVIFAGGMALRPPSIVRPIPRTNTLLLVLAGLLVLKEFLPAVLFGGTQWRSLMTGTFGLELPWTHHPEPGRAVDALLSGGLAVLWLLWVRTLAAKRENRAWLAWGLAGAAAAVAAVSFLIKTKDPSAIFGLRYTPGWIGFGPFPNRNHTAAFFAMGVIMSCGVVVWEIARKHTLPAVGAALCALVSMAGVLATQSRGGVIGLAAGLVIYGGFCVAKFRDRRAVALTLGLGLAGVALALAGESTVMARFSAASSESSNQLRVAIWTETVKMWSDAPLLGHGAGAFASIFPLYAHLQLDNEVVLHPESSWLAWLVELGLIPLALAVWLAGSWVLGRARTAMKSHRSFFLYAAGFATCGGLLCHSAIDVPAHRWATAAYALAALGLACPRPKARPGEQEWTVPQPSVVLARRAALVPLAAAFFWVLPFLGDWPAWSPLTLDRELAATETTNGVPAGVPRILAWFPLSTQLHHLAGVAGLKNGAPEAEWQTHFEVADRLSPGFWSLPALQARECGRQFPQAGFHFWQLAIEHSGWRMAETFNMAYEETLRLPNAQVTWGTYIDAHPALALEYVTKVSREEALPVFANWWEERGANREVELSDAEIKSFYRLAATFSSPAAFATYMQIRPALAVRDYFECARVLHAFGDDVRAWHLLSTRLHDPELPASRNGVSRRDLERSLALNPGNGPAAQGLAALCMSLGDEAGATEVLLNFANRAKTLPFFTRKAAYIFKARGQVKEAVEMMLREAEPGHAPAA